jgi:hypothetical protein
MKALTGLLVVLLLLAGALVAADRVGESYASNLIAQRLASRLGLAQDPKVDVKGVPFLTQWASGSYQEVEITAPSVTTQNVTVNNVQAIVKDIHTAPFMTSGSQVGSATAGSVDLTGLVPFSDIPLPSGFTATPSGSQLKVAGSLTFFGASIPVTAMENLSMQGPTLTLSPTDIRADAGGVRVTVPGSVAQELAVSVDTNGLPFGVHVTGVTVRPSGLAVTAQAQNVSLAGA